MSLRPGRNIPQAVISLPSPRLKGNVSLEETIVRHRSVRRYAREPLKLSELGQALSSAQGITGGGRLRAVPNTGATYPLEVFVVAGRQGVIVTEPKHPSAELQAGIYHYKADSHSLTLYKANDLRQNLARAGLDR